MSLFSGISPSVPFDDLEKPLLAGPFRLLDRIFTGGRVVRAFRLGPEQPTPAPVDRTPDPSR